jgi:hypothetical protein
LRFGLSSEEVALNWNKWVRQFHRWLSIAFTVTVIANFVAQGLGEPPLWVVYSPLLPLFLLLFSGLYMFALPLAQCATRRRTGMNTMAGKTSKTSAKVAKKAAAKKVAVKAAKPRKTAPKSKSGKVAKPVLLAGGNPQIAKGYGDAPVQAYIAAMPGWKSDVGRRLDALIERTVPGVHKAVKWNSPLYGIEGPGEAGGWFLGVHVFTKYVKVAFFRGASLRPVPPGASKSKDTRYLDIHEDDQLDEAQFAAWVKQASQLPGERM